jgi:N-acyl-L-homoserine lactone synthetase
MMLRLSGRDEARHPQPFEEMFRQRHDIFVRRRGWQSLSSHAGLERDCYDGPDATYVLAVGSDGALRGSARLLSTQGPHLLSDIFPHLVEGCAPRGPEILELTRFYIAPGGGQARRRRRIGRLSRALFSLCQDVGVTTVTSVVDILMLTILKRYAWRYEPLGPPGRYGEGRAVAVAVDVAASIDAVTPLCMELRCY